MVNAEKTAAVAELTAAFRDASAAVLTEYRGLTVAQLKELRRALAGNATYTIVKNTLTTIAMRDAGLPTLPDPLTGPTAVAFVSGDPVLVAKGLREFGRTHPLLVVKGGVLDGRPLSAAEVRTLADLESREVLLARMAGALTASLSRAAALFAAPASQVARLAAALQAKVAEDPSAAGGTGSPGAAAAAAAEAGAAAPAEASSDADGPPAAGTPAAAASADSAPGAAPADEPTPADPPPTDPGADGA